MMNRRKALGLVGKVIAACAGWMSSTPASASVMKTLVTSADSPQETASTFDKGLQAEMTRLGTRVYSEEGIPMILACEDLTAKTPVAPSSKAMNVAVTSAFRKYMEAWQRLHPSAPAGDVAKLLELLAYRDFSGGGKDNNL